MLYKIQFSESYWWTKDKVGCESFLITWPIVFPVATFSWLSVAILASFQVSSSISTLKPIRMEMK